LSKALKTKPLVSNRVFIVPAADDRIGNINDIDGQMLDMKTDLKKKVEKLYNTLWILFFILFGLDFITTNLSIHVFGLQEGNSFLREVVQISNPFLYLGFFILVLAFAYGGTEYWRQKGIDAYGRKSQEIITFIAMMVPLALSISLIPVVLGNLQRIISVVS
jgi:hypothetical protein